MNKTRKNANGSGSISKRADGRWEGKYTLGYDPATGKQIRKSVYGKTQREVASKLRVITESIENQTYVEPNHMKLRVWLNDWLTTYNGNIKQETYDTYEMHIRVHLNPYIGDIELCDLESSRIQKLYNYLQKEKGLSPKTVCNIHGVFHKAMKQAMKLKYIPENPLDAVIKPRVEKPEINVMDDDEFERFLITIKGHRYQRELFTAVCTGVRQGELLGITWDCISFENNTIVINKQHTKGRKEKGYSFKSVKNDRLRMLTVADEVMDVLRAQKEWQKNMAAALGKAFNNSDNLVFTTYTGRYVCNKTLYTNFKAVANKIGVSEHRFHDLRHTYAVNSLKAGDDIKTLQENLGHSTASFTLSTYAHATMCMKKQSAKNMSKFLKEHTV